MSKLTFGAIPLQTFSILLLKLVCQFIIYVFFYVCFKRRKLKNRALKYVSFNLNSSRIRQRHDLF